MPKSWLKVKLDSCVRIYPSMILAMLIAKISYASVKKPMPETRTERT